MELEKQIFNECWFFFKKYYEVRPDDAYWSEVANAAELIGAKYNHCALVENLLITIVNHLENRFKELHPKR